MKKLFLLMIVFASTAQADVMISPRGTAGDVIFEQSAPWMPAHCRITYNYSTNVLTVEPRPEPVATQGGSCSMAWIQHLIGMLPEKKNG